MSPALARELERQLGADGVRRDVPLGPLTTFQVGGPAEWLVQAGGEERIRAIAGLARDAGVPLTVLGGGSNVLIGDRGVPGIVLIVRRGSCRLLGPGRLEADAGLSINGLVRWCVCHGVGGLERWAGTPGSLGGALWGNAHFQGELIGARVQSVRVLDRRGELSELPASALGFGYDQSRLQRTGELALSAELRVEEKDPAILRATARQSLLYRKRTQPLALPSAGCIFQNPAPGSAGLPDDLPASAGALIERAGLKGHRLGGARVSPVHANFIVNEGGASAADVAALAELCRQRVSDRFGVELREEIVRLGEFSIWRR